MNKRVDRTRNLNCCLEILQKHIHLCDQYEKTFISEISKKSRQELLNLSDSQREFLISSAHQIAIEVCLID